MLWDIVQCAVFFIMTQNVDLYAVHENYENVCYSSALAM